MLIAWGLMAIYIIAFFSILALIGTGYLVSFAVQRIRIRRLVAQGPLPGGMRRAYNDDALKAA
ncbi:MAG: hypothetical protein JW854_07750 [Actinobacteria bacterium]|nr:hypothetical protein [Actinomycetota bacterium]